MRLSLPARTKSHACCFITSRSRLLSLLSATSQLYCQITHYRKVKQVDQYSNSSAREHHLRCHFLGTRNVDTPRPNGPNDSRECDAFPLTLMAKVCKKANVLLLSMGDMSRRPMMQRINQSDHGAKSRTIHEHALPELLRDECRVSLNTHVATASQDVRMATREGRPPVGGHPKREMVTFPNCLAQNKWCRRSQPHSIPPYSDRPERDIAFRLIGQNPERDVCTNPRSWNAFNMWLSTSSTITRR